MNWTILDVVRKDGIVIGVVVLIDQRIRIGFMRNGQGFKEVSRGNMLASKYVSRDQTYLPAKTYKEIIQRVRAIFREERIVLDLGKEEFPKDEATCSQCGYRDPRGRAVECPSCN